MRSLFLSSVGLSAALLLGACVADPHRSTADVPPEKLDPKLVAEKNNEMHLDVVQSMMDKGQYYAALAHLQDIKHQQGLTDQTALMEADCRRHLDQTADADAAYRHLLGTSVGGQAYHGLGLLYVKTNLQSAIPNLRRAAQLVPTDADIRNDYGRALMEAGRYNDAMPELSTAAELAPNGVKSRRNLIILMMLMGNESAVNRLAQQAGAGAADLQKLRTQAQAIKAMQTTKPAVAAG